MLSNYRQATYLSTGYSDWMMKLQTKKENIDKCFSWIKDKIFLGGSISSIILFIVFIINVLKEVSDVMTPSVINIIGAVFFLILSIGLFYLWLYQRSERYRKNDEAEREKIKSKCEERINKLKNQLNEETKKYDENYTQIKSELEAKIKEYKDLNAFHESDLKKRVQLTYCDIKLHYKEGKPKLTITQNLINMSYAKLVLKSLVLYVKVDGAEIDKIVYDFENAASDLGKKIFLSDLSPFNKDCWITCETTKLLGVMSNYQGEKVKIEVDGEICFYVQSEKVTKKIKKAEDLEIGTKEI